MTRCRNLNVRPGTTGKHTQHPITRHDRAETRYSAFVTKNPLPPVLGDLISTPRSSDRFRQLHPPSSISEPDANPQGSGNPAVGIISSDSPFIKRIRGG